MSRRSWGLIVIGLFVAVLFSWPAFAQYRPYPNASTMPNIANGGGGLGDLLGLGGYGKPSFSDVLGRIAIDLIAALLGLAVGAFFSPLLRPFRRIVFFVVLVAITAYAWLGYAPIADIVTNVISVFAFFVAVGYGLQFGARQYLAQRNEAERPTSFGSAKWATEAYLRENGMFNGQGFLLGTFTEYGQKNVLHYDGQRHLLTVAPTRSGKGVSSIIPNLLTYDGSALVIDPKGENAQVTALRRGAGNAQIGIEGMGQNVFLVDPWDIAAHKLGLQSACFNPLDWIKKDDPDAIENAFLLADALVLQGMNQGNNGGTSKDQFWDEEAKALLCGLILYVATSEKETQRHLGRVRDLLTLSEVGFRELLTNMSKEPNRVIASTALRTAGKETKLRSSVMAVTQAHTHFLESPRIRHSLSRSDFRFEDLKAGGMTVFLILPADRLDTFGRWLRLLIQQAITTNARNIDIQPKRPVLFLLDEMAALGRLTMVEQAYSLMAGFGLQLWGIVQDLSQLNRIYGDGWQTFISNSGVIQYFGSRDKISAEYFSTLCGVTTIRISSLSYALAHAIGRSWGTVTGSENSSSNSGGSEGTTHTHTTSTKEEQRQLAFPDELMVLKADAQIVFVENLDPISAHKVTWHQDSSLSALGVNLHDPKRRQPAQIQRRTGNISGHSPNDTNLPLTTYVNSPESTSARQVPASTAQTPKDSATGSQQSSLNLTTKKPLYKSVPIASPTKPLTATFSTPDLKKPSKTEAKASPSAATSQTKTPQQSSDEVKFKQWEFMKDGDKSVRYALYTDKSVAFETETGWQWFDSAADLRAYLADRWKRIN